MPACALTITTARIPASRGPETTAGKARSCRNATRHGLFSRDPIPIPDTRSPTPKPHRRLSRLVSQTRQDWLNQALASLPDPAAPGSLGEAFAAASETAGFRMIQRHESRAFRTANRLLVTLVARRKF